MDKYYTPEPTEFHIGFCCEYKRKDSAEWIKLEICDEPYCLQLNFKDFEYRVEYLTKEQIEGEGWVYNEIKQSAFAKDVICFTDNEKNILQFSPSTNIMVITRFSISQNNYLPAFVGTINNLSEFRRLLKQLGINRENQQSNNIQGRNEKNIHRRTKN